MAKKKQDVESLVNSINESFARWDHIYQHGTSDPFWPDGVNANLVRNHIIYFRRQLEEMPRENGQQDLFLAQEVQTALDGLRPVPDKLPDDWMCPTGEYPDRLKRTRKEYAS